MTSSGLRKQPQQERSRAMVERIVTAGREVLAAEGYERTTTNRVADAAGISPGSLYQYFPDKHAILDAVVEAHSAEIGEQLSGVVTGALELPPVDLVRTALDGLLDILIENREYVRMMARQLPRARIGPYIELMERRTTELVGTYLTIARPGDRIEPATSAWLVVRMVEHLCIQYVLDEPAFTRETLIDELTRMTLTQVGMPVPPRR